jgi:hypothetical protein
MHTTKITHEQWQQTLDELSRVYDGALVSLEILGDEIGAQPQILQQPLHGVTVDHGLIEVHFAKAGGSHLCHSVAHPLELRMVATDEGALVALEIEELEGTHTLLHFTHPMLPELLDPAVE